MSFNRYSDLTIKARRAVCKQVENLMGFDVDKSDGMLSQRDGDEADQHIGELIVYKV